MIKIVLSDFPDKYTVGQPILDRIATNWAGSVIDGVFETIITTDPMHRGKWEVEVRWRIGMMSLLAFEQLNVDTRDMFLLLWDHSSGDADEFVRYLVGDDEADRMWREWHTTEPKPELIPKRRVSA